MDIRALKIRGYAAPFNQVAECRGPEFIAAGAFAKFLRNRREVFVNAYSHDAEPIGNVTSLFEDRYGLAFEATINCSANNQSNLPHAIVCGCDGVSINMSKYDTEFVDFDGQATRRITAASIDHLTITSVPVYSGTVAWIADLALDRSPSRIQIAAVRWGAGRKEWAARQRSELVASARTSRALVAAASSRRAPAMVAIARADGMTVADKYFEHAQIRALARNEGLLNGSVFGHVAFRRDSGARR